MKGCDIRRQIKYRAKDNISRKTKQLVENLKGMMYNSLCFMAFRRNKSQVVDQSLAWKWQRADQQVYLQHETERVKRCPPHSCWADVPCTQLFQENRLNTHRLETSIFSRNFGDFKITSRERIWWIKDVHLIYSLANITVHLSGDTPEHKLKQFNGCAKLS